MSTSAGGGGGGVCLQIQNHLSVANKKSKEAEKLAPKSPDKALKLMTEANKKVAEVITLKKKHGKELPKNVLKEVDLAVKVFVDVEKGIKAKKPPDVSVIAKATKVLVQAEKNVGAEAKKAK